MWGELPTNPKWVATAFADIADNATVIIISNSNTATNIALPAAGAGTSNPPKVACTVTTTDGVSTIAPPEGKTLQDLAWTIKKKTSTWQFFVEGSTTNCLYLSSTSSNTALRVGNGSSNNEFVMGDLGKLLKVSTAARFVGPYDNSGSDWRTYGTENATNYKGATLTFYVLQATPSCTSEITISKADDPSEGKFELDNSGKVCIDEGNATVNVTATPNAGYHLATVTSTVGTVGTISNNACQITGINANTTISVAFEADPAYTVSFNVGGSTATVNPMTEASAGAGISLPEGPTPTCSDDWEFAGWKETSAVAEQITTAPTLFAAGANYKPASNCTLYAVYKKTETSGSSETQYVQVTGLAQVNAGGEFIITNGAYYLPSTTSTSAGPVKADMVAITDGVVTGTVVDAMKWTISAAASDGYVTVKNAESKYLYATNSNSGLRVGATEDSWKFEEYTVSEVLGFAMQEKSNSRWCAVYTDGSDWRPYGSKNHTNYKTNSGRLDLYKATEVSASTTYYLSNPTCTPPSCEKKVNISAGETPEHGTFELDKTGNQLTCDADVEVIVTPTPDTHYHVGTVSATTGETGTDNGDGTWTITYAQETNYASTINVTFEEDTKIDVTWSNNGVESTTKAYPGDHPTWPEEPESCDATSTTFIGWVTEAWSGKLAAPEVTVYTSAEAMPIVEAAGVKYYAVFAKSSGAAATLFSWEGGKSADLSALDDVTLSSGGDYADANSPYYVKFNGDGKYVTIAVASQPGKVTFGVKKVGGAKTCAMKVQEADAANGEFTDVEELEIAGESNAILNLETTQAFKSSTRAVKLYFAKGSGDNVGLGPISIEGAVTYSNYMTTCCTKYNVNIASGITNGSVSADLEKACEGTTVTLTFTPALNYHLSGWTLNGTAQDKAVNTFTMPAAAVTVSATFEQDECTPLGTPSVTVSGKAYPYDAVKLAWTAVTNADKYKVYIYDNDDNELEHNDAVTAVEYTIGQALSANTTYKYSVQAISNTPATYCPSTEAASTFKTDDLPTAHLTLVDPSGTHASSGDYAILTPFNLPDAAAVPEGCPKVFVGWDSDDECATTPEYAAGAEFTFANTTGVTLYAVYATATPGVASLTKMASTDALTAGDKIIVVAHGTQYGIYQETQSNSYVKYWELANETPAISELNDKKIWDVVADGDNWKFGDATDGYLYTSGSNNLAVSTENATTWSFTWNADNEGFILKSTGGRYLACRTDLTGDNANLYRMSGTSIGTNGVYGMDVYKYAIGPTTYSEYSTECEACNTVTLKKSGEDSDAGNTFALKVGDNVVEKSVTTCEDASVTIEPTVATGYEVSFAINNLAGASLSGNTISLAKDATGELTVTATFSQKNYSVVLEQSPAAGATLSGAADDAHYGETINLSATNIPANAQFVNWTSSDVTITNSASATEASFTMPAKDVTVTANFLEIHNVAWAIENTPASGKSDFVYVKGIVTGITEINTQYGNATYYISDLDENGEVAASYLVFRAKKEGNTDYTSNTQLKEGDEVIVYGKLTNYQGTKEFDQGGYIITNGRTAATFEVVVSGTAAKTDYYLNETFAFVGLTAKAEYSTGYKKNVTEDNTTIWKANNVATLTVTEAGTINVTATWNETTSEAFPVMVTVTTKVLESIELSETALTGYKGIALPKPTTVTAHFDDQGVKSTSNVTAFAIYDENDDYDASLTSEQTIEVKYGFGLNTETANYTVTLSPVRNTLETAYTVAKGREIINVDNIEGNNLALDENANKVFVAGLVTAVSGNTYTIKDNAADEAFIEIKNGTLGSGISSVVVGDRIKVEGNLYFYENNSHTVQKYQITNGEIVKVVRTPEFSIDDVAEMEVNITADLAEADLTIDRDGSEGAITFSCTDPAVTIVENKLHAAAAGDATVTATMAASGEGAMSYAEATTTFNVHVIAERKRFAITMDKNGGSGEDPEYANQLAGATVDLPADNTYSKANSAFAGWVVNDGAVEITDGHFTMPAADVTIKATWNDVETCRISFQVSGSEVEYVEVPQTVEFNLAGVSHPTVEGFEFVGWSKTEYAEEVTALPTTISSYTPEVGESTKTLYGIYSQVVGGASNLHYVLDYADENLGTNNNWGDAYSTVYPYTAADGGEWTIKAYKNSGMQINTNVNNPYIKVPNCAAKIIQVSLSCNSGAKKAVKFAESVGGDALANGSESISQTLDLSGESVTTGYILPTGNCQITHIDVEYSGNVTYYTSSPVTRYNVTYAKGDATNVTGVCEAQRHAAGTITLCDAPTCADKNFAKWFDGSSLYAAGASYTLSADVTFTATWTPKPKYTVTYTANGGTGTAPAVEEYMEGETVEVKENEYFSKPGFVYAGWQVVYNDGTDHIITPNDEGEFEMVAYNVTIKALWEEPSNQKWVRVESTDELDTVNGTNYIIVAKVNDAAMGALNGSYYNSIGIVKTGNYLNGPESMTKVTLAVGSEEGKYAMKNGTKYIYSTSAKNIGEGTESFDWTITITNGEATINAGTAGKLQFNTGNPRFTTYTSSQQAVAIYREKALTPIDHDGMTEDDVNTYDDVEIGQDKTWTVSGEIEVGDVYMKEGAVIANSAEVTANDLYFKAKAGKSNQIFDLSKITVVSNLYYDFQLCDGDVDADYWYSISVPFDVNLNDGVFQVGGTTPLVNHSDFEVWEYDTQKRADTQSNGWKRSSDNMMHAGKAYLIGFNPGQPNIIRLKAAANWKEHLFSGNEMSVVSTGSGDHDNWNGLANPTGRYIDVDAGAQVFNNNTHQFDPFTYDAQAYNFVVGTAFFVQSTSAITMSNTDHGQYRAPKREDDSKCAYAVRITRAEAASFDNQIIVRASEDATREYEQGHDMVTMNNATSKTAAMLWTKNYGGKRLAIEEAPFSGDKASYELGIYAPAAGEYAISVPAPKDNADLYLTKNGMIIWNLSMNECTLTLDKGNNEGFGLLLVKKAPEVSTGVESTEFSDQNSAVQKVIIDEHVYILREGQMYDVTGKMVK